jgi:hypothetical protein
MKADSGSGSSIDSDSDIYSDSRQRHRQAAVTATNALQLVVLALYLRVCDVDKYGAVTANKLIHDSLERVGEEVRRNPRDKRRSAIVIRLRTPHVQHAHYSSSVKQKTKQRKKYAVPRPPCCAQPRVLACTNALFRPLLVLIWHPLHTTSAA